VTQFVTQFVTLMLAAISLPMRGKEDNGLVTGERANTPRGVSDVWQTKDLQERVFGSVAMIGLSRRFPGSVANTGLSQRGEIGTGKNGLAFEAPLGTLHKRVEAAGSHLWRLP